MIRNIKVLGLAVVAMLAMSALGASAAQAAPELTLNETTAGGAHDHVTGTLHGEQISAENHVFTAGAGNEVKCKKATFTGSASSGTLTDVTAHPEYNECTAFGLNADVTTTGCNYTFTNLQNVSTDHYTAEVDNVCSGTSKITITVTLFGGSVCTVTIGSQNGLGPVDVENMTTSTPTDITIDATISSGITYTETSGCPEGAGTFTNGGYTGNTTVTAKNTNGEPIDLEVTG